MGETDTSFLGVLPAVRKLSDSEATGSLATLGYDDVDFTGQVILGRYSVDSILGSGAMGRVYRGRQLSIDRAVAIKVLRPDGSWDHEVARQRLHREATFLARVQHPNVVNLIDYGITDDGHLVMVLEFLPGRTLKQIVESSGPLPHVRVLNLSRQLVRALRRIHRLGGIHRDVKTSNIMVEDTEDGEELLKLLDFGLIKVHEQASRPSDITGSIPALGTPLFISPEQALGEAIDARTDIYAAGVLMFYLLAGRPPYIGANTAELLNGHIEGPIPEILSVAPDSDVHPEFAALIRRCLAKHPEDRYPDTDALYEALRAIPEVPAASGLDTVSESWEPMRALVTPVVQEPSLALLPDVASEDTLPAQLIRHPVAFDPGLDDSAGLRSDAEREAEFDRRLERRSYAVPSTPDLPPSRDLPPTRDLPESLSPFVDRPRSSSSRSDPPARGMADPSDEQDTIYDPDAMHPLLRPAPAHAGTRESADTDPASSPPKNPGFIPVPRRPSLPRPQSSAHAAILPASPRSSRDLEEAPTLYEDRFLGHPPGRAARALRSPPDPEPIHRSESNRRPGAASTSQPPEAYRHPDAYLPDAPQWARPDLSNLAPGMSSARPSGSSGQKSSNTLWIGLGVMFLGLALVVLIVAQRFLS